MSGGGQWCDHVPPGCCRLICISRRWGWSWHLPGGWPDGGTWSTSGKWTQRHAAPVHAAIPDLTCEQHSEYYCLVKELGLVFERLQQYFHVLKEQFKHLLFLEGKLDSQAGNAAQADHFSPR